MGLPQLDFRVPEATWFKSALAGKFGVMPGLSATGALAWPYKVAVVAVMALVACGTLVTFGSARAETPSSSQASALPGSDEASPTIEGQVLPPSQALLDADDLMSSLNLTDYSPEDTTNFSLTGDDDDEDDEDKKKSDEAAKAAIKKKLAAKAKASPTPKPKPSETTPVRKVEGPKHKQWEDDVAQWKNDHAQWEKDHAAWKTDYAAYEQSHDEWQAEKADYEKCVKTLGKLLCKEKEPGDEPTAPDEPAEPSKPAEPEFTS